MRHIATFGNFGRYGCVVVSTKPRSPRGLTEKIERENGWTEHCLQLGRSAFFMSLGSDGVGQPISIYTASDIEELRVAPRSARGRFSSKGEVVYIEQIDDLGFDTSTPNFYLGRGDYIVHCFTWGIEDLRDISSPYIDDQLRSTRHEIVFVRSNKTKA